MVVTVGPAGKLFEIQRLCRFLSVYLLPHLLLLTIMRKLRRRMLWEVLPSVWRLRLLKKAAQVQQIY